MNLPRFVLLSKLTPEGRQTLHADPDRIEWVNEEMTHFGCKLIEQRAVMGEYDFVTVIEAPDNETVAELSIALGARGTVQIVTLPAIPLGELRWRLQGDRQLGHD